MKPIVETVAPGVWRLSDARIAPAERSFFYLVRGERCDCLIDGGWGLDPVLEHLPRDGARPLMAVATHSHFDHIGALWAVADRRGHRAEAAIFAAPDRISTQAFPYLKDRPVLADGGALDEISLRPCPLTAHLSDGDTIDLGGRRLEVLHTPGHSPGSVSLFDGANGLLLCADTVHDGFIYDAIPGASRSALLVSHRRLLSLPVRLALPGHGASLDATAFRARILDYAGR